MPTNKKKHSKVKHHLTIFERILITFGAIVLFIIFLILISVYDHHKIEEKVKEELEQSRLEMDYSILEFNKGLSFPTSYTQRPQNFCKKDGGKFSTSHTCGSMLISEALNTNEAQYRDLEQKLVDAFINNDRVEVLGRGRPTVSEFMGQLVAGATLQLNYVDEAKCTLDSTYFSESHTTEFKIECRAHAPSQIFPLKSE